MSRRIWWGDFRTADFGGPGKDSIDPDGVVAVLPVAAIEQHGPHLPVSTDAAIMAGMLETAVPMIPGDLDIRILPVQEIGKSDEHQAQPGTLTVPATMLIDHWTEIGASVARAGLRKLVIVSSHGGNGEVVGIVARQLRIAHSMLVAKTSWERFGLPQGLFSETETRYGIHGGDYETSLMLHFRPDLVDMARAENFASRVVDAEAKFRHLRHTGQHSFSWMARDLGKAGVVGEAAQATAEKGRLTAEYQAKGFVELLGDVASAKLADWIVD